MEQKPRESITPEKFPITALNIVQDLLGVGKTLKRG